MPRGSPHEYTPYSWRDLPDQSTPISSANLAHIENGLQAIWTALGAASGFAPLGPDQKVPAANLPAATLGTVVTPEQYGAVGDGVTDDSAAFQAAITALASGHNGAGGSTNPGGTLQLTNGKTYVAQFVLDQGVTVKGSAGYRGIHLVAYGTTGTYQPRSWAAQIIAPAGATGYIIDTPPSGSLPTSPNGSIYGCALEGFVIEGTGGGSGLGGVRFQNVEYGVIRNMNIGGVTGNAVNLNNCVAPLIDNLGAQSTDPGGLTAFRGTVHMVNVTDGTFRGSQINGGGSPTSTTVHYANNFYRCAIYVGALCAGNWFWDFNGEFADVGIVLDGSANGVSGFSGGAVGFNTFTGTRADYNSGHGWFLSPSSVAYNRFNGARAFHNSLAGTRQYDGFYISGGGFTYQNEFSNCDAEDIYPYTFEHRFGFNDKNILSTMTQQVWNHYSNCQSNRPPAQWMNSVARSCSEYHPNGPLASGGGNINIRPASRSTMGKRWFDTTTNTTTISTGTQWVTEGSTAIAGNLFGGARANGVTGWTCSNGTQTLGQTTNVPADRVTGGQVVATGASAVVVSTNAAVTGVVPGATYSFGMAFKSTVTRNVTLTIAWQNSSGAPVGTPSSVSGTTTSTGTAWDDTPTGTADQVGVVTATAPNGGTTATNADRAVCYATFAAGSAGDTHYWTKAFLAPGTLTGFVEA